MTTRDESGETPQQTTALGERTARRLDELRRSFDAAFAEAPATTAEQRIALLSIRVGGDPAAIRVLDTLELLEVDRIVAVPSRRPELLGLIGLRGAVVPVYSLARLTGRAEGDPPRWAVLAGSADRIALAFTSFERHVRVAPADVHPVGAIADRSAHVAGAVEIDGVSRPILDVASIARAVTAAPIGRGGTPT